MKNEINLISTPLGIFLAYKGKLYRLYADKSAITEKPKWAWEEIELPK